MESGNLVTDNWITVAVGLGSLLFLSLSFVYWWTLESGPGGVPKGSLGWPLIGETLRFFSGCPPDFVQERVNRYGKVFKSHFMGRPIIFVTDLELSAYVLADRRNQFNGTSQALLGNLTSLLHFDISSVQGEEHNVVHRAMISSLSADVLLQKIGRIEDLASSFLNSYVEEGKPVTMVKESRKFALHVLLDLILHSSKDGRVHKKIEELFEVYTTGFVALPINLPGSALNKALKAKAEIAEIFLDLIDNKIKKDPNAENSQEILHMLQNLEKSPEFTKFESLNPRKRLSHLVTDICFAGYESVGMALSWAIQDLYENPEVLQAVTVEHDKIRTKKASGERLTRADIQSMTLTSGVIHETLRRVNVLPGILRQATQDVEFNGYKIPKGWNVQISVAHMHMNPEYFEDALSFDPSRFQKTPKRNSYIPFGIGGRRCVGNEVAKMEMTVFLYYLTSYRWARIGNHSGITSYPFPVPNDSLPIQVYGKKSP